MSRNRIKFDTSNENVDLLEKIKAERGMEYNKTLNMLVSTFGELLLPSGTITADLLENVKDRIFELGKRMDEFPVEAFPSDLSEKIGAYSDLATALNGGERVYLGSIETERTRLADQDNS